ncbi:MAG: hypothetical protein AAGJ68_09780, partial [Pseudomonadota bacterium]
MTGVSAQTVVPAPHIELVEEKGAEPVETTPEKADGTEFLDMIIEGELTSVRTRVPESGERRYNLTDIAEPLKSRVELHDTLLGYHRRQDGVLMSINMADGKVRSNKTVLGKLPKFEPRETADPWIGLNAVTIMTGTHASEDYQGRTVLTLDAQLKPKFGLELWVNGVPVDTFGNEPRTIGPVLFVPLEPIVNELGHELTVANGTATVRRQQDQATIHLELATGLISVNTTPRGVAQDMQLAERDQLVLPFGAVESLTGTHIKLVPMSNRVEVTLDTRLTSTVLPGADLSDAARNTPLTIETLTYEMSDRGPLRTETRGHVGLYNFRAQLDTSGGFENFAATQPGWASLDVASLEGWQATLGDYSSNYRELSGVGANRIRGAAWRKARKNGDVLAIAAGVPLTGAKVDSDTVSVPSFGGFAAGARLIDDTQLQDVGIAASISEDGESASIVANGQRALRFEHSETGWQSAFVSADLGAFSGGASGADIRVRGSANYALNAQTGLSGFANYEGAKFVSGADRPSFAGVFDQRVGARTNASLGANWRADQPMGALNRLALSTRASVRHQSGDNEETSTVLSAAANSQIGENGPTVSAIVQHTKMSGGDGSGDNTTLRVRGVQRFDLGTVTAAYSHTKSDTQDTVQQLVATAQMNPIRKGFEKGAVVQIAPNLNLNWDGEKTR